MKNLRLFKLLFMLFCINGYGQLQNANWIFGNTTDINNWVHFGEETPENVNSNSGIAYHEGCASVSDLDGNLIFTTNGVTVTGYSGSSFYPVNIGNPLKGHLSSTQNVIIVPKPNHPLMYYIFTIDGDTGLERGIHYTEFDFSSGTGSIVGNTNIPLRDINNNLLNTVFFHNKSEGITSTIHSDCNFYWVVAHIKNAANTFNAVLSYKVTESGVVGGLPEQQLDFLLPGNSYASSLKISPDTKRIALGANGGAYVGLFDNNSGVVTLDNNPIGQTNLNTIVYGVEFSSNSNVLYFSELNGNLKRVNLLNNNTETFHPTTYAPYALQRAIDGRIYIATEHNFLSVITNPNDVVTPLTLNNLYSLDHPSDLGLPQWVWQQEECCLSTLVLGSPLDDMSNNTLPEELTHRERRNWIKASNHITVGNNTFQDGVVYHAGDFVELLPDNGNSPGFQADFGAQFVAYIEECSGNYVYRNGEDVNDGVKELANDKNSPINLIKNKITIYPNPTNNLINVSYNNSKFNQVSITSMEGRIVYNQKIEMTNGYQLDISNFKSGIYTLSIVTVDGNVLNEKLIKN